MNKATNVSMTASFSLVGANIYTDDGDVVTFDSVSDAISRLRADVHAWFGDSLVDREWDVLFEPLPEDPAFEEMMRKSMEHEGGVSFLASPYSLRACVYYEHAKGSAYAPIYFRNWLDFSAQLSVLQVLFDGYVYEAKFLKDYVPIELVVRAWELMGEEVLLKMIGDSGYPIRHAWWNGEHLVDRVGLMRMSPGSYIPGKTWGDDAMTKVKGEIYERL